ncbi:major facilitator superfamily domain-containing protein [Tuber borchii]|uniref:Major facilitator superfamily domain-containing protein n=1 Tax=Tuber borchii TaxID=42251 RepID=A0A2T6ZT52_TUBBO|nr:major facilitator superfamily domain-containing protein [Tuber borchii]
MATTAPRKRGFPTHQLFVLSLCRICEPISFCSILPYIYYMTESFGIAKNENEIAIYAGMVTSAFAFAEFTTGMMWGRISDKFGRKPVLIMGLVGTMLSMLMFGFAKSFPMALIARAIGGGLNGNVGVIQTTVAELATEKEYQARAFAVMPFIWCLGSIIGPTLGGLLAEPVKRYPAVFHPGGVFEEYPYLLPSLVSASILVVGIIIGTLFLEETHQILREKPDIGVRAGRKIVGFFKRHSSSRGNIKGPKGYSSPHNQQEEGLLVSGGSEYSTFANAPTTNITEEEQVRKRPPTTKTFTTPVVLLIVSYGILAYHTMGAEQIFPVFLATPRSPEPPHHLFKFTGGFGLDTQSIGFILAVQGVASMIIQFFFFPLIVEHFGILSVYRFCMFLYPISYLIVPYIDFLPPSLSMAGVYAVLLVKIVFAVLSYPCNAILLTNAAPSLLVLGTINGIAASTASICRAFGPAITGVIYTQGLDLGMVGLAWWANAGVCVLGGIQCLWMEEGDFYSNHQTGEVVTDGETGRSVVARTTRFVAGEECNEHTMAHKVADEEDANSFTEEADMGGRERS